MFYVYWTVIPKKVCLQYLNRCYWNVVEKMSNTFNKEKISKISWKTIVCWFVKTRVEKSIII